MLPLRRILTGVVALTAASLVLASAAHALQVGQKAPEFTLVGPEGKQVSGGATSRIVVNLKPGSYTFYCSVPGHEQAGMKGTLTVR